MTRLLLLLEKLIEFTRANITGFEKILKKFDKWMEEGKLAKDLWPVIANARFMKSEGDEILLTRAKLLWRKRVPLPTLDDLASLDNIEDHPEYSDINEFSGDDGAGAGGKIKTKMSIADVPTFSILDLDSFPWGKISRLWITLAEDGLSSSIRVPVIVAKGVKEGPIVGITAALHGNELNGIPLIHRLFRELKCSELHGIVVAVPVANSPGYL